MCCDGQGCAKELGLDPNDVLIELTAPKEK